MFRFATKFLLVFINLNLIISAKADVAADHKDYNVVDFNKHLENIEHKMKILETSSSITKTNLEEINVRLELLTSTLNTINVKLNCGNNIMKESSLSYASYGSLEANTCSERIPRKRFSSCADINLIHEKSGLYDIQVHSFGPRPFSVYCDFDEHGGGWTVFQRRMDGSVDFYRNWKDYKVGFGNLRGEFFLGLDKLWAMTTSAPQELLIVMEDFENTIKYARYDAFAIGDESEKYSLKVLGKYSGDATNSLKAHVGFKFTTKDQDNDNEDTNNCAVMYTGAWWYNKCHSSNLNGQYLRGQFEKEKYAKGVTWSSWRGQYYSLKIVKMMIRPVQT